MNNKTSGLIRVQSNDSLCLCSGDKMVVCVFAFYHIKNRICIRHVLIKSKISLRKKKFIPL